MTCWAVWVSLSLSEKYNLHMYFELSSVITHNKIPLWISLSSDYIPSSSIQTFLPRPLSSVKYHYLNNCRTAFNVAAKICFPFLLPSSVCYNTLVMRKGWSCLFILKLYFQTVCTTSHSPTHTHISKLNTSGVNLLLNMSAALSLRSQWLCRLL